MSVQIMQATSQSDWDSFLFSQPFRPFLQSWTMGEVFRDIGQEPLRLIAKDGEHVVGICQAILVPARRGRHLAVQYGPVIAKPDALAPMITALMDLAREHQCSFIRLSPFVPELNETEWKQQAQATVLPSPLHLLGEHVWYLPLRTPDFWNPSSSQSPIPNPQSLHHNVTEQPPQGSPQRPFLAAGHRSDEELLMSMRKTTRNLVRRAEKDGVTVRASTDPIAELQVFLKLHSDTKSRHRFTPYRDSFFRAQVEHFAPRGECTLYIAEHEGQVLASSIHMHTGGETSYHHGASVMSKVPASYLLQWTAIKDALKRGDHVYSFWGIAPVRMENGEWRMENAKHPFAGVTLFKTGFGGNLLNLMHCIDIPLSGSYRLTRAFEFLRKWKRGF